MRCSIEISRPALSFSCFALAQFPCTWNPPVCLVSEGVRQCWGRACAEKGPVVWLLGKGGRHPSSRAMCGWRGFGFLLRDAPLRFDRRGNFFRSASETTKEKQIGRESLADEKERKGRIARRPCTHTAHRAMLSSSPDSMGSSVPPHAHGAPLSLFATAATVGRRAKDKEREATGVPVLFLSGPRPS